MLRVLRKLVMGHCKSSELQVLYEKICVVFSSVSNRGFFSVQDKCNKPMIFYLRLMCNLCFRGRKACIKMAGARNEHIYYTLT